MIIKLGSLTGLQCELLRAALNTGGLRRARGGYLSHPDAKPFSLRTVMALQRMGLLSFPPHDTKSVALTYAGSALVSTGEVELTEALAG